MEAQAELKTDGVTDVLTLVTTSDSLVSLHRYSRTRGDHGAGQLGRANRAPGDANL